MPTLIFNCIKKEHFPLHLQANKMSI